MRLHVVPADSQAFEETFVGESWVIGRASTCDLVVTDRYLSRHHARLYRQGNDLWLEDLESRNGTFLNGRRIDRPTIVNSGDVINICQSLISLGEGPPPTKPAPSFPWATGTTVFRAASDLLEESRLDTSRLGDEPALRRSADRLRILNEVHQALGRSVSRDEILEIVLDRVFDHLDPEEGMILLRRPDGELYQAASRFPPGRRSGYLYSRTLIQEVTEKGLAALVLDAQSDDRFAAAESIDESGVRSVVAAPLLDPDDGSAFGMIVLDSRMIAHQFSEDDMQLLVTLAAVAALRLRNVELAEEAVQRRQMERELTIARDIQMALLPDRLPELEGYQLYAGNTPSQMVSGDYFVVLEREGARECVLMVADVCGKGVAASLLTAALEALCAGPIADGLPADEICARISSLLHDRTPPERFATAFLGVLEPATGRLIYANAGHNPALLLHAGEPQWLCGTGLPLGLLPDAAYDAAAAVLEEGDTLVIYTDGITEAANPSDEEFGKDRLLELCHQNQDLSPKELATAIEGALEAFAEGVPAGDDCTLLIVRRLAGRKSAAPLR